MAVILLVTLLLAELQEVVDLAQVDCRDTVRLGLEGRQVHVAEEVRVVRELKLLYGDAVTAQSHSVLGAVNI